MDHKKQAVAAESWWRYPAAGEPAPKGTDVCLLTEGGIQVTGVWSDDGGFIAWAPKIKRNKAIEAQFGLNSFFLKGVNSMNIHRARANDKDGNPIQRFAGSEVEIRKVAKQMVIDGCTKPERDTIDITTSKDGIIAALNKFAAHGGAA